MQTPEAVSESLVCVLVQGEVDRGLQQKHVHTTPAQH
jgi:hypothetical protein